jgi:hypothetical protein
MIGQEPPFLETYSPEVFFPGITVPQPGATAEILRTPQDQPINVGALQAGQVQAAAGSVVSTVGNMVSGAVSWIQSTGNTVVLIAVLGFGAWALSSLASFRRE